jgi:oligoribonuclease (3'-5' exoribonuclease)
MSKLLLWCDTETTGLDPVTDDMLEVAFIVTEDLQIVDEISFVIKKPDIQFLKDKCIPKVYEMHNQNSLWLDLESAKFLMPEVEEKCISFIEKYFDIYVNDSYNAPVLAGSNPIFDKNFLRQNMPTLYELLH